MCSCMINHLRLIQADGVARRVADEADCGAARRGGPRDREETT